MSSRSAEDELEKLLGVGVDYSVQLAEVVDWLGNPDFTPYPAIAAALLELLAPEGLRRTVYIDVVAFNYEQRAGNSPRRVEDIEPAILAGAVVEASNVRYGTEDEDLSDLLK